MCTRDVGIESLYIWDGVMFIYTLHLSLGVRSQDVTKVVPGLYEERAGVGWRSGWFGLQKHD